MGIFLLITLFVFFAGAIFILYLMVKDPHNTFVQYLFSWQYRMLRRIRAQYKWGQQKTPPDSYDFFLDQSEAMLREALLSQKPLIDSNTNRVRQAKEIIEMLQEECYVKQYFNQYASFSGMVYHRMYQDYRTGDYIKNDYSVEERLKKILPSQIVANEKAFREFMKFVYAGWFDKKTGMFIVRDGRTKYHIGRAVYWICKRNYLPPAYRIFSSFWGENPRHVRDWCTKRSRDAHITDQIDKEVKMILEQ